MFRFIVLVFLCPLFSWADSSVLDQAGVFSIKELQDLSRVLEKYNNTSQIRLQINTYKTIKEIPTDRFPQTPDGPVVLIQMTKFDRKIFLKTRGVPQLANSRATQKILNGHLIPRLQHDDFLGGIENTIRVLARLENQNKIPAKKIPVETSIDSSEAPQLTKPLEVFTDQNIVPISPRSNFARGEIDSKKTALAALSVLGLLFAFFFRQKKLLRAVLITISTLSFWFFLTRISFQVNYWLFATLMLNFIFWLIGPSNILHFLSGQWGKDQPMLGQKSNDISGSWG